VDERAKANWGYHREKRKLTAQACSGRVKKSPPLQNGAQGVVIRWRSSKGRKNKPQPFGRKLKDFEKLNIIVKNMSPIGDCRETYVSQRRMDHTGMKQKGDGGAF